MYIIFLYFLVQKHVCEKLYSRKNIYLLILYFAKMINSRVLRIPIFQKNMSRLGNFYMYETLSWEELRFRSPLFHNEIKRNAPIMLGETDVMSRVQCLQISSSDMWQNIYKQDWSYLLFSSF